MKREFIWHRHPETDEVFMIIAGSMLIELRDKTLTLTQGDKVVIPKHKPSAQEECHILLIEPAGTINTGNAGGDLTDTQLEWL